MKASCPAESISELRAIFGDILLGKFGGVPLSDPGNAKNAVVIVDGILPGLSS